MYDIITFGSASWDIFLRPSEYKKIKNNKFISGRGICFNLGSKVDISEVNFSSGGAGTNTAATFVKQGYSAAYCGKVGDDISGNEIINELKRRGVNTDLMLKTDKRPTNHSVVINILNDDRTILAYRGASELVEKEEIPWEKLKAKWFYIAPLAGQLAEKFSDITDHAKKNGIKVAVNLGNSQISLGVNKLKKILEKIDIILLNQEEASLLTKIPFKDEDKLFKKIDEICPGIAIMTKGDNGVSVSDGINIYKAKPLKTKLIDKTGAGDAFGSAFVSEYIRSNNIEAAIQLATANARACIENWGAKGGLLDKDAKYEKVTVKKEHCAKNGFCKLKIK